MPYRKTYEIDLEFINEDELLQRLQGKGKCILVDTVWTHGGNRHRIRGAKTIPYPEVLDRRREFDPYDEVIVYCTKKTCPGSKIIAKGLKLLNVPGVKVYEGGIRGWMARGLPVEEYSEHPETQGVTTPAEDNEPLQRTSAACRIKTYVFYYKCLTAEEVQARLEAGPKIILVDMIGSYGGNRYKIPGAKTIPYPDVIDRRRELAPYDEIILYSRSKTCDAARKRAVGLHLIGFENVKVYDAGLDDWMDRGFPVIEY
jgi:rhodanese-related sulfurtransferase